MTITHDYLSVPKRLIHDLRDNALAIAIYFFVARLYLVQQRPVPLSREDIRKFDPSAKPGAIKRALDRLIQAGWLVETIGHKSSYVPAWGTSRSGMPYRWQIGPARLGRPTHIETLRVDRALLDLFIGKFMPHRRNPCIESYFTRPLLGLQDIGAYILISAELPADATEELYRWGLVRDGQAQLVPDDAVILALASQRVSISDFQLTEAGWRKLGWFGSRATRPAQPEAAAAVPLIFVPKERIGSQIPHLIGHLIGGAASFEGGSCASERGETAGEQTTPTMLGIMKESRELRDVPPIPPMQQLDGGGTISLEKENDWVIQLPDTEAARALFAFGVNHPDCLVDLATMPGEQVGGAINYAESEDLGPGWVVTALRRHRDEGWPIPRVRRKPQGGLVDWDAVAATYGDLFRSGSDISSLDWSAVDSTLNLERPGGQVHPYGAAPNRVQPGVGVAVHTRPPDLAQPRPLAGASSARPQPVARSYSARDLTQELRSRMQAQCDRSYHRVITGLQVRVAGGTTVIHCASLADRLAVLDALMGALRWCVSDLGLPKTIRVTDRPVPDLEPPDGSGQPTTDVPLSS